jgi:hypothetical protein
MTGPRVATIALCAAALLAPAAPASADAGWLAADQHGPTLVSNSTPQGRQHVGPVAAMGPRGHALLAWNRSSYTSAGACCRFRVELVERAPGGAWTDPRTLPGTVGEQDLVRSAAIAATGAAVVGFETRHGISSDTKDIRVALRSPTGVWSAPATLAQSNASSVPQVAISDDGRATAVWTEPGGSRRLLASTSGPYGWSAPVVVVAVGSDRRIHAWELEGDGHGGLVVGMTIEDVTRPYDPDVGITTAAFVATRSAGGSWSGPKALGPWADGVIGAVEVNRRGDAAVTWTDGDGLHLVRRPAGGAFGASDTLSASASGTSHRARFGEPLALGDDGHVTVTWEAVRFDPDFRTWTEVRSGPLGGSVTQAQAVGTDPSRLAPQVVLPLRGGGALLLGRADGADADSNDDHMRSFVRPSASAAFGEVPTTVELGRYLTAAADGAGNAIAGWTRLEPIAAEDLASSVHSAGFDGAPPVVEKIDAPSRARIGEALTFTTRATDVWSPVRTLAWDMGDGTTILGARVRHAFGAAGRYAVRVTATDARGLSSTSDPSEVVVTPARGGAGSANPPGAGPLVPVRTGHDRIRVRFVGGLVADRRGIVRLRLVFDAPLTGSLRLADVFGRTLGRRTFTARSGVPVRLRIRVPRWTVRKLRRGRIPVRASLDLTLASGRQVRVTTPTTLRLAR